VLFYAIISRWFKISFACYKEKNLNTNKLSIHSAKCIHNLQHFLYVTQTIPTQNPMSPSPKRMSGLSCRVHKYIIRGTRLHYIRRLIKMPSIYAETFCFHLTTAAKGSAREAATVLRPCMSFTEPSAPSSITKNGILLTANRAARLCFTSLFVNETAAQGIVS